MLNTQRQNSARSKPHMKVSDLLCTEPTVLRSLGKRQEQKRLPVRSKHPSSDHVSHPELHSREVACTQERHRMTNGSLAKGSETSHNPSWLSPAWLISSISPFLVLSLNPPHLTWPMPAVFMSFFTFPTAGTHERAESPLRKKPIKHM